MSTTRLSFDYQGIDALERKIQSEFERLQHEAVIATGKAVTARAKHGTFKDHTRQLRSTISMRVIGSRGAYFIVQIEAPQKYASFVEKSTEAHDIWPKAGHGMIGPTRQGQSRRATGKGPHEHIVGRGLALRWKDAGGDEHFAAYVHHPGSKPYAFMEPALDYGRVRLEQIVRQGFAGIATRLEK